MRPENIYLDSESNPYESRNRARDLRNIDTNKVRYNESTSTGI